MTSEVLLTNKNQLYTHTSVVAELLVNDDNELLDYSLHYPCLKGSASPGEKVLYGIINLCPSRSNGEQLCYEIFNTVEEAEDFILE